jgi:hypothetical protein
MRHLFITITAAFLACHSHAQTLDTRKVNDQLAKKDYVGALREWAAVKRELQQLATAELMKALPQAVGELKINASPNQQGDAQGGITLMVLYMAPPKEAPATDPAQRSEDAMDPRAMMGMPGAQPSIQLTVTTNLMMANEVIMAHGSDDSNMRGGDGSMAVPLRIKGYRALMRTDRNMGTTGQMIVGGAYIRAEGRGMTDDKAVTALLNTIDTDLLKRTVGE